MKLANYLYAGTGTETRRALDVEVIEKRIGNLGNPELDTSVGEHTMALSRVYTKEACAALLNGH